MMLIAHWHTMLLLKYSSTTICYYNINNACLFAIDNTIYWWIFCEEEESLCKCKKMFLIYYSKITHLCSFEELLQLDKKVCTEKGHVFMKYIHLKL